MRAYYRKKLQSDVNAINDTKYKECNSLNEGKKLRIYLWSVSETRKSVLENEIIKMVIDNISDREVKDVMEPLFS